MRKGRGRALRAPEAHSPALCGAPRTSASQGSTVALLGPYVDHHGYSGGPPHPGTCSARAISAGLLAWSWCADRPSEADPPAGTRVRRLQAEASWAGWAGALVSSPWVPATRVPRRTRRAAEREDASSLWPCRRAAECVL